MRINTIGYLLIGCCCAYSIIFGYYFSFKVFSYVRTLSVIDQALAFGTQHTSDASTCKRAYRFRQVQHDRRNFEHLKVAWYYNHSSACVLNAREVRGHAYNNRVAVAVLHGLKRKKYAYDAIANYNLCNDD